MSSIWAFDNMKNKHNLYRGEDITKSFCSSLRGHARNVIIFEKMNMIPLAKNAKVTA